jgi:hypothetical protein
MGLHSLLAKDKIKIRTTVLSLSRKVRQEMRERSESNRLLLLNSSPFLNVLTFRSNEVPNFSGFREYMAEVSSNFCPFIEPSMTANGTTYTVVSSDIRDRDFAEKIIFACGYAFSEILRFRRTQPFSGNRVPLLCENILFLFQHVDDGAGKALFGWPHWVLKCRYTQLGILFGKFWKGASETSKDGRNLPVPPCHLLSIRESVRAMDPQFFEHAEWLRPSLELSQDIGQNVFGDLVEYHKIAERLNALLKESTSAHLVRMVDTLMESDFYARAKELAAIELESHKHHSTN